MSKKLTPKQKKFADKYLETGNATKAAKEVYSVVTDNAAAVQGSRVLRNDKIQTYLERHAELARNVIVEIAKNTKAKDNDRLQAAKDILDRTEGKPVQRQINANADTDKQYRWAE